MDGQIKSGYTPAPGRNGVYELATHPGVLEPYNGRQRTGSVYVVGLEDPDRLRLFTRADAKLAVKYAKETKLRLHHLPARALPHPAMLELFGE